jgi:hypothetical protein
MIAYEQAPLGDRATARLASVVSHLSAHVRPVGTIILGSDPRIERVAYGVVTDAAGDRGTWAEYDGDPDGTNLPWPRLYKKVTRTQVHRDAVTEYYRSDNELTRLAIAWKLGEATVAAPLSDEQSSQILDQGFYDTRLGGGKLLTTMGIVTVQHDLIVARNAVQAGEVMDLATEYPKDGIIY